MFYIYIIYDIMYIEVNKKMNNRSKMRSKATDLQAKLQIDDNKQFAIDYLLNIRTNLKNVLNEKDYCRAISSIAYADLKRTFKKNPYMAKLFAREADEDYINCIISGIGNHPERINFLYWDKMDNYMRDTFNRFVN